MSRCSVEKTGILVEEKKIYEEGKEDKRTVSVWGRRRGGGLDRVEVATVNVKKRGGGE